MQTITSAEMKKIDNLCIKAGISVQTLMENAGKVVAEIAKKLIKGKNIVILCGKGNNAGDGLAAARLLEKEFNITIVLTSNDLHEEPKKQLTKLKNSKILNNIDNLKDFDLIIDALLGFSIKGNPREPIAGLINLANKSNIPLLSIDLPSGLDADTGKAYIPCIKADYTITLGLAKKGLINSKYTGKLYIGDIGIPKNIIKKVIK